MLFNLNNMLLIQRTGYETGHWRRINVLMKLIKVIKIKINEDKNDKAKK